MASVMHDSLMVRCNTRLAYRHTRIVAPDGITDNRKVNQLNEASKPACTEDAGKHQYGSDGRNILCKREVGGRKRNSKKNSFA